MSHTGVIHNKNQTDNLVGHQGTKWLFGSALQFKQSWIGLMACLHHRHWWPTKKAYRPWSLSKRYLFIKRTLYEFYKKINQPPKRYTFECVQGFQMCARMFGWLVKKTCGKSRHSWKRVCKRAFFAANFCMQRRFVCRLYTQYTLTMYIQVYFCFLLPPSLMQKILEKTAGRINGVDLSPTNHTLSPPHKYSNVRLEEFLLYTFARLPY